MVMVREMDALCILREVKDVPAGLVCMIDADVALQVAM
jgi:hypothetical protein